MILSELGAQQLISRLEARLTDAPAAISFDADGTLWSGDVAEDVFGHAVRRQLLRSEPHAELARVAAAAGIEPEGSPSAIAQRLFDAYLAGRYPEREVCEMMTWCFAGYSPEELGELARSVLASANLDERLQREVLPLMNWARSRDIRVVVISASPRPIVEHAAGRWGIEPGDIAAATAVLENGLIQPRMLEPVPYAEAKVTHGRRLIGEARWLAAFGDSAFDVDMLAAAEVRVAVRPKPGLLAWAGRAPGLVALRS